MLSTQGLSEAAVNHLTANGIEIRFRIKNNAVVYSLMNRPSISETGLSNEKLAVCLVHAGQAFQHRRISKPDPASRELVTRDDGKQVRYDQLMTLDWNAGELASTRGKELTLQVLSIVIQDLMRSSPKSNEPLN